MKIYACFEGETDIGALEVILKNCVKDVHIEFNSYTHSTLMKNKTARVLSRIGKGLQKDDEKFTRKVAIRKLAILADRNGDDHIAYHQDADRKFSEVYGAINIEFKSFKEKGFYCLPIVPKEMTESWLLADVKALNKLGEKNSQVSQPPLPETLWGNESDPNSNHPYNYLVRLLERFGLSDNRDIYTKIAKEVDIEILKNRCPKSFGKFYEDMQSFITEEPTP